MTDLMSRPQHYSPPEPPPAPPAPPTTGGGDRRWPRRVAGGAALLMLVAGGGTAGAVLADHYLAGQPATATGTAAGTVAGATTTETGDLAAVVKAVQPSIVTVLVDSANATSLGSGVVLNADGLILTNNHVIASDGSVSVRLSTGQTVPAEVVVADSTNDLALVQARGLSGLTPATFGSDSDVVVGDTVLAFGAPLGLENTVTSGIVSATDRSVNTGDEKLSGLLQTDAAINEGNSGGALVDTAGRVVGINVAIATASEENSGSIGVGFAIPADTVKQVVAQLQSRL